MGREDQHRALTLYSSSPVITNTCSLGQSGRTEQYQAMIPDMVQQRRDRGQRILAVDFTSFPTSLLRDCIHPTNEGYKKFGDYWYDFITQIPREWINRPAGEVSDGQTPSTAECLKDEDCVEDLNCPVGFHRGCGLVWRIPSGLLCMCLAD